METENKEPKKRTRKTAGTGKKPGRPRKKVEPVSEIIPEISEQIKGQIPDDSAAEPTAKTFEIGKKYTVKCKTVLNVRIGPGKNHIMVNQLKNGTVVTVFELSDNWGRIGRDQWVMLDFLT